MQFHANAAIYTISVIATGGVIIRPWRFPEAIWAVLGAVALVAFGLISLADALTGILKGLDVYYFLAGMVLLAELARREGLFDWLAALAAEHAKGSTQRLFTLIYLVAIVVTALLSNDATAVVLTPAVYANATNYRSLDLWPDKSQARSSTGVENSASLLARMAPTTFYIAENASN